MHVITDVRKIDIISAVLLFVPLLLGSLSCFLALGIRYGELQASVPCCEMH